MYGSLRRHSVTFVDDWAAAEGVAPDAYFDDLEEDLEDDTPAVGLVEEEEVTDEEEYDFHPVFMESEDHVRPPVTGEQAVRSSAGRCSARSVGRSP